VGGAAFGKSHGQQIGAVECVKLGEHGRVEHVRMDGVGGGSGFVGVDAGGEFLGAQPAVQPPLVEPGGLEGLVGGFGDEREDVGTAEGDESALVCRAGVGIAGVPRRISAVSRNA
jgi:hypothetical protein